MRIFISITGLCVLVPAADQRSVDIVMPRTNFSSGGATVHLHDPMLFYPGIRPNAPDMLGFSTDLRHLQTSGVLPSLANLLDISELTGGTLDEASVVCRITLPVPNAQDSPVTYDWEVTDRTGTARIQSLTHQLNWTFDDADLTNVLWERVRVQGGGAAQPLGTPIPDAQGNIHIVISHLPRLKHRVCKGHPADHALGYIRLFGGTGSNFPRLHQNSPDCRCPESNCTEEEFWRVRGKAESAFNCMLATA